MIAPKNGWNFKRDERSFREQIYCRRHNRLYTHCPVEDSLHLCECLSQCEMALRNKAYRELRNAG